MNHVVALIATLALAGCAAQRPTPDYAAANQQLDSARAGITPPLGATTYELDRRRLLDQPGGENQPLAQSLARLPGVTLSAGGQVRIRGQ